MKGGWISDRVELTVAYPLGSWLCYHIGGCSFHSHFLPTQWQDVGASTVRVLRHGLGVRCCCLLLHSALSRKGPVSWRSIPWIPAIFGHRSIRRVSLSNLSLRCPRKVLSY